MADTGRQGDGQQGTGKREAVAGALNRALTPAERDDRRLKELPPASMPVAGIFLRHVSCPVASNLVSDVDACAHIVAGGWNINTAWQR